MNTRKPIAVAAASLAAISSTQADWPQWRGPGGQGVADSSNVPTEWSETKNVAWRTNLPGRGWSSPLVIGNQIWVTAAHETLASREETKERLKANTGGQPLVVLSEVRINAICIDKVSGEIVKNIESFAKKGSAVGAQDEQLRLPDTDHRGR